MIFAKDLLLKGLAGLAVCGGAATLGVHYYTGGFSSSLSEEVNITNPQEQLGLPTGCNLPAVGGPAVSCNLTNKNINNINFEGKSTTQTSLTGTGTLKISIPGDGDDEKDIFPHGYKVTITATGNDITITRSSGNIVLKTNQATDFKIKQNAKKFSLEKAWTAEDLAKKVGLEKSDDHWTIGTKAIKVKYESGNAESKIASPAQEGVTQGKIKAYVETTDSTYNKDIKFVIEDGDIALTGEGTTITKLEQFETYEIKKERTDWLLIRKTKAIDEVKKALGLPTGASDCNLNNGVTECSLDQTKLDAIKFKSKGNGSVSITDINSANLKLKISKTTDANFTHGYKFVLESAKDITIPQTGSDPATITIKAGTNTEFKIKKGEGNDWSLEKAWTFDTLKTKVGLTTCQNENGTKKCSFGTSINVYESATSFVKGASLPQGSTDKKITYEEGVEGYNQGIKLSSTENLTLQNGTGPSGGTTLTQIAGTSSGTPTYEIKEIEGT